MPRYGPRNHPGHYNTPGASCALPVYAASPLSHCDPHVSRQLNVTFPQARHSLSRVTPSLDTKDQRSVSTATAEMTSKENVKPALRNESDVYDRQIRLWGAEAQAKMSKAKVLYIHVTGVSSEILKNLVLAGIKAVVCDPRPFPSAVSTTPSFFLSAQERKEDAPAAKKPRYCSVAEAVQPMVQDLNPLLGDCEIVDKPVEDLDEEFLQQFRIVIASHIKPSVGERLAAMTTKNGGTFYMVDSFGMYSASAFDLGPDCRFRPELGKQLLEETSLKTYVALSDLLKVPLEQAVNRFHKKPPPTWLYYRCILEYVEKTGTWPSEETADDFVKETRSWVEATSPSLLENELLAPEALQGIAKIANCEIAPVCSVMGGFIGNETIKVISGKGEPANNTLLFDSSKVWTFLVQAKA